MTNKKLGFLTLRAQPLHAGHRDMIRKARLQCDELLILIGSANSPRTIKNPFTFAERQDEIMGFLQHEYGSNTACDIYTFPLNDYKYSDSQWLSDVASLITEQNIHNYEVVMFGHMKEGNHYLDWFPQYKFQNIESEIDVHATGIRDRWFKDSRHKFHDDVLADWDYFEKEKLTFANYPFPETLNFCCGDAVVECAGHILLIKRNIAPGRNTWALPGGFKNNDETYLECVFRELIEETNIRVAEKVLRGSVVKSKLYDSVSRGMGIPRNTLAVHIRINLNPDGSKPRVSPRDDAKKADWFPIHEIMNDMSLFDDHGPIISEMCATMPLPAHKNSRYRFNN